MAGVGGEREGRSEEGEPREQGGAKEGSLGGAGEQGGTDGKPRGKTCAPEYEAEKKFRDAALATAHGQLAKSGRVVAGGGLATTLANEAIASETGMKLTLAPETTVEALLFSEGGPRAVYAVAPEKAAEFENAWKALGFVKIGEAGGDSFDWDGIMSLSVAELTAAFTGEN